MAKKKTIKEEAPKEIKAETKTMSKADQLQQESLGYFKRFENISEIYANEAGQFFFKENDCIRNAAGGKVYHFKKSK